jgi:hypothetical protein
MTKTCKYCGKEFETQRSGKKYCSYRCYAKYQQEHNPDWGGKGFDVALSRYEASMKLAKSLSSRR